MYRVWPEEVNEDEEEAISTVTELGTGPFTPCMAKLLSYGERGEKTFVRRLSCIHSDLESAKNMDYYGRESA